jgi:tripartite-type tricarboxylate transporter receptor subunit TctC
MSNIKELIKRFKKEIKRVLKQNRFEKTFNLNSDMNGVLLTDEQFNKAVEYYDKRNKELICYGANYGSITYELSI